MNYTELLKQKAQENKSIVCVGFDPVLEKIPLQGNPEEVITKFYKNILNAFVEENCLPGVIKLNIAFFEPHGFEGLRALETLISTIKKINLPVILDAKRGDIGRFSTAYAKTAFEYWKADATTVAPYMGSDSVGPFIDYSEKGKGVYILCRTSNKGAVDIQDLKVGNEGIPLYMKTAEKIIEWAKPGTGAVIGATYPKELEQIAKLFSSSGKQIPLLIPGVGTQGGSAQEVIQALKNANYDLSIVRINSSSGINYAYQKQDTDDYAGAAVKALKQLNQEIGFKP